MSCDRFRSSCIAGLDDAETREHLRACADCLAFAVEHNPDALFQSLGGELTPPGGVDAFVDDVMQVVRVRATDKRMARKPRFATAQRWALAASLGVAVMTAAIAYRPAAVPATPRARVASRASGVVQTSSQSRPIIEAYDALDATIVEVPTDPSSDLQIVMVFDESLPVDL